MLPSPLDKVAEQDRKTLFLEQGAILFHQQEKSTGLYFLVSGTLTLSRTTDAGHSVVLHQAKAGDTFAEASLFSDVYHCTATATRDSRLIQCSRQALLSLFDTDTAFARQMAARFATQIQTCRRRMEVLSIRAADARIMAALHDGLLLDDISEFAAVIGLAPETVYRTLSRLAADGRVRKTARGAYRLVSS